MIPGTFQKSNSFLKYLIIVMLLNNVNLTVQLCFPILCLNQSKLPNIKQGVREEP